MEQGKRIFYERDTGYVFFVIPEMKGNFKKRSLEEEISMFKPLGERNPDTFDVIELEYGQYAEDFKEADNTIYNGYGFRVNLDTLTLEFAYRDPNEPVSPPVFRKPLSEEIEELRQADIENKQAIAELTMMIAAPTT